MPASILPALDDPSFRDAVAHALSRLPGVEAVMLGGSRAAGRHTPESDWDFSIYYRGAFDVGVVRALEWPGEVSELGGWGGGVFNGGAWLALHYARKAYAERGDAFMTLGSIARALLEAGHARLAREGIWITNEKGLLARAGFGDVEEMFSGADWFSAAGTGSGRRSDSLVALIDKAEARIRAGV